MTHPNLSTLDTLVHFRPGCLSHLLGILSRLTTFYYIIQLQGLQNKTRGAGHFRHLSNDFTFPFGRSFISLQWNRAGLSVALLWESIHHLLRSS